MNKLWFSDTLLARATHNVRIQSGPLAKHKNNPLFFQDMPWEKRIDNGYPNVFLDPSVRLYRCYYTCVLPDGTVALLYAVSTDGLVWNKPSLGLCEWEGSCSNNILMTHIHGGSVLYDIREPDAQKRYKLVARDDRLPRRLVTAHSADGIHFSEPVPIAEWAEKLPGDTHNVCMRDSGGLYHLYTRVFNREQRACALLTSLDFETWTFHGEVCRGMGNHHQVYAMPVFEEGDLYWGLAAIYNGGDASSPQFDHVHVEITYSGDGENWHFLNPGSSFLPGSAADYDGGCCFASAPVKAQDGLRFYYMAASGTHYGERSTALCLVLADADRLTCASAADFTLPFQFQTRLLQLNGALPTLCADLSQNGLVRYELLGTDHQPLPHFQMENCEPLTENAHAFQLNFHTGHPLPTQAFIRFHAQNASLYHLNGCFELLAPHG